MLYELLSITESFPTPFLIIEEAVLKRNIDCIGNYANGHGFAVRPHVKTHKSIRIARMQLAAGATGLAVAKVGEAEVMASLGSVDLTIAYPAVGRIRAGRIAELSLNQTVRVAVDSAYSIEELGRAALEHYTVIGILVIFDAGLHRCGITDPGQIVRIARQAEEHAGLRFDGIQMYLGHLYGDAARDPKNFEQINRLWEPVYESLCASGLHPETVSSGSTPSLEKTHLIRHVNEILVGTAVLNDYFVLKFGHCRLEDCAARVVTTVVSDAVPGQIIIDTGSKALSAKQLLRHEDHEMGYVVEYPEARITRLHEEHGWVDTGPCKRPPKVGERMSIVPVNVSLCMNLYDHVYVLTTDGKLQKERVDARGRYV